MRTILKPGQLCTIITTTPSGRKYKLICQVHRDKGCNRCELRQYCVRSINYFCMSPKYSCKYVFRIIRLYVYNEYEGSYVI